MRFLLFILLLMLPLVKAAQFSPKSGMLVRLWQSQDGLPSNVVRSVVQASDGYLWVSTAEGVARFDGFDFEVIEPELELRRNRIAFSRMFATGTGDIWVSTYQGGLMRVRDKQLVRVLDDNREASPPLVTQLLDFGGRIYYKRGEAFGMISEDGAASSVVPWDALLDHFHLDLDKRRDGGRVTESAGRPRLADRMGRLWAVGASGGLTMIAEGEEAQPVELPQRNPGYAVSELMEDREGNVWVAAPATGLVRVRASRVEVLDPNEGQNDLVIAALTEDHSGTWWFASRRGGVTRWTENGSDQLALGPSPNARTSRPAAALFEDRNDRLWVASRDGSVFTLEGGVFKPQFSQSQVPSKVRSITEDSKQTLWFAGAQGLASFDGKTVHAFSAAEGVGSQELTVVQPYPGGKIIAGSAMGRVLLGDARGFETIGVPEVFKNQWISGIFAVSETETWVSTLGSGLYLWNGMKWTAFDVDDGLPDSRLTCVLSDGNGYLWFGSLGGIIRAERKELLRRAKDSTTPVQWLRLDHTDGLPSRECIGGFQPAGWRGKDGHLWFPMGGGVARVKPRRIEQNQVPPPVFLKSVRANGVIQQKGSGVITTDPGRARLEFRFVGLSFSAPEKITYRVRLAGLDDAWRELGNQRVAAFEAVPPGKYFFEVMAVNGDGQRSRVPARIAIVINPHYWQTPWFYVTVGLVALAIAVGSGWLAARLRMKRGLHLLKIRHAREGERSRIARDLHDDLGASLTEISILAALAAEDADQTPLQPSLDQLSVKAKHVVGSLDEIVWAVNPREDTLRSLVDYIAAFAREFLDIARIPLRVDVAREIPEVPLASTRRHAVFLACREALNNIVKHSGATQVNLAIHLTGGMLEIRIEDNGCGFEPDYATGGNGIGNLSQRMHDAGGSCGIETFRAQGTTICLSLPLPVIAKSVS